MANCSMVIGHRITALALGKYVSLHSLVHDIIVKSLLATWRFRSIWRGWSWSLGRLVLQANLQWTLHLHNSLLLIKCFELFLITIWTARCIRPISYFSIMLRPFLHVLRWALPGKIIGLTGAPAFLRSIDLLNNANHEVLSGLTVGNLRWCMTALQVRRQILPAALSWHDALHG